MRRFAGYYLGQSCAANVRTRHPDGSERPCAKTGRHAREGWARQWIGDAETLGPWREFFCDQHVFEVDAGLNILDPERPRLPKGR